ncbi:Haloacid dehalogenase-like hydrolase family protein [Quillaja saponaria]|uniref:Haloacid dehalogenase-like hydrolase family protein n=1 Tax=Quillaja saponaria TaxID=32244 RepID=A0AAD7VJJ1_QUISA|nr:Haloacid dehalogenase-like hydrolase family protein [Quillaja saponaria]
MALSSRVPFISWPLRPSLFKISCIKPPKMANSRSDFSIAAFSATSGSDRKQPILLFDIMDTVVRDPFYQDIPAFFGMSLKELIECKHPTAWIEFEMGRIDEMELARIFFKDGRHFDLEGLKSCMREGYSYIEGIEELLLTLKQNNYEMHAFTNYPIWYKLIEDKLKVSTYLSWTFCSCSNGKRKPDPEFYLEVLTQLKVDPKSCIFIDDRLKNVEAAIEVGINGVHFKNASSLREDLSLMGIEILKDEEKQK